MTGFSPRVRAVITERDGGCVMCRGTDGVAVRYRGVPTGDEPNF